jgi:HAD superfamily hydrolase (TIGR01509 family)
VLATTLREWNRPEYGNQLLDPMASAVVLGHMDDLFTDTRSTLIRLRSAGVGLGVISNWNRNLPQELARLGLDTHFQFVIVSAIVGVAKPSPEIFHMGLRAAGCDAHKALYVGDNVDDDCVGAHGVGMHVALIDRSAELGAKPPPCTRVYSSLEELTDDLLRCT